MIKCKDTNYRVGGLIHKRNFDEPIVKTGRSAANC